MRREGKETNPLAQYIGIGIALGVAFGAAIDNMGVGIALGIAIGAGIGTTRQKEKDKDDPKE